MQLPLYLSELASQTIPIVVKILLVIKIVQPDQSIPTIIMHGFDVFKQKLFVAAFSLFLNDLFSWPVQIF